MRDKRRLLNGLWTSPPQRKEEAEIFGEGFDE